MGDYSQSVVYQALRSVSGDSRAHGGEKICVRNAGYYAVECMRQEKGYRAWGHELSPDDHVVESGLGFTVSQNKNDFLGREAVAEWSSSSSSGVSGKKRLLQLTCELPNIADEAARSGKERYFEKNLVLPWGGEPIYFGDDLLVGWATSSAYSFSLDRGLFMGYVRHDKVWEKNWWKENKFSVELFGTRYAATAWLPNRPAYDGKGDKIRDVGGEGGPSVEEKRDTELANARSSGTGRAWEMSTSGGI